MAILSKPLSYSELFIRLFYNNLQRKQIITTSVIVLIFLLLKLRNIENASLSKKDLLYSKQKGRIDWSFFKKLFRMSQIIAPSIKSIEDSFEIFSFTLVLLSRTILTLYLADINGKIVKALINKSFWGFLTKLFNLALCAIPASFLNCYIEYMKQKITLNVRTKLIQYAMQKYLSNLCFYDLAFLNNTKNCDPIDTFTDDIYGWAHSFSDILCNSIKNSFDILFFTVKISYDFGWKGPIAIMLWYLFSGCILRFLSPPLADMTAKVRTLEYEYKDLYTHINENAEQLAFYKNCNSTEKSRLMNSFQNISNLNNKIIMNEGVLKMFEGVLHKFGSVISAYLLLGLPVFGRRKEEYLKKVLYDPSTILRDIASNSFILVNLRKVSLNFDSSFNRFLTTLKELYHLSGNTNFVLEGMTVIEKFSKDEERLQNYYPKFKIDIHNLPNIEISEEGNSIKLSNVEIISPPPENNVLVNSLDFEIKPGMNTMFMGPLGCGKTAMFRILTGVWPLKEGRLQRPKIEKLAYASHLTYFPEGTLRDEIIYPDGIKEMRQKERKDEDLQKILEELGLHYLVDKIGGFDMSEDWNDVLDAMEKQTLQIARVVYHCPIFVILDECINFNEVLIFKVLKDHEITALTISHKSSLFRFHNYLLRFDGEGGWSFEKFKSFKKNN